MDGAAPEVKFSSATLLNKLDGTTYLGGNPACGCGTVFKLDATGKETVLYSFTGGADGARPFAGVILDAQGNLYGTTFGGGVSLPGNCVQGGYDGKRDRALQLHGRGGLRTTARGYYPTRRATGTAPRARAAILSGKARCSRWIRPAKRSVLHTFTGSPERDAPPSRLGAGRAEKRTALPRWGSECGRQTSLHGTVFKVDASWGTRPCSTPWA